MRAHQRAAKSSLELGGGGSIWARRTTRVEELRMAWEGRAREMWRAACGGEEDEEGGDSVTGRARK
eukprot:2206257-Rhodomonas_salina.1